MKDPLGYSGKRVVVTGAASGMGAATTAILIELGAEVHALDITKPDIGGLASFTECDLREPDQIDAAVKRIGKIVNNLFNCAGAPNSFPALDVMLVNFCGLRHLTEQVIPMMPEGSTIASIAAIAGAGWAGEVAPLVSSPDFAAARAWCAADASALANALAVATEAVNAYTVQRAESLAPLGIRVNCVNLGTDPAEEQAWPLALVNSPRASLMTGTVIAARS